MTNQESSPRSSSRPRRTRRGAAGLAVLAAAGLLASAAVVAAPAGLSPTSAAEASGTGRGTLLGAVPLEELTAEQAAAALEEAGLDTGAVRTGVQTYRLEYRTVGLGGEPVTASGLVAFPTGGQGRDRVVSYSHSTSVLKRDAPSTDEGGHHRAAALAFAAAGDVTVAPDYLGLGTGEGNHPWMNAPTEASAGVDLLRAAAAFAEEEGRGFGRDVLAAGFSQGAHAAMALAGEIALGRADGFALQAAAGVSGPYDLAGAELPAMLNGETDPMVAPSGLARMLVVSDWSHDVYRDPSEVFRAPYADRVEGLFDGTHDEAAIMEALPPTVEEMLTEEALSQLDDPSSPLVTALAENSRVCGGWAGGAQVRLWDASGDTYVSDASGDNCLAALEADGADAVLTDLGEDVDHIPSGQLGTAEAVAWFDELR